MDEIKAPLFLGQNLGRWLKKRPKKAKKDEKTNKKREKSG
jgi:hypothetical protein